MTRMTTDVDALSNLLQSGLINALVALFTFAGVGVALVAMNWVLGLVTMTRGGPAGGGDGGVPAPVRARLPHRPGAHRRGQRQPAGEPVGCPRGAGVRAGRTQPARLPAPGQQLPRIAPDRPAPGGHLLPVRRAALRHRRRARARRGLGARRPAFADRRRAHRLPALPGPVLQPHPAAVADLRLLPAGGGVHGPDQRADAGAHHHPAARAPGRPVAGHRPGHLRRRLVRLPGNAARPRRPARPRRRHRAGADGGPGRRDRCGQVDRGQAGDPLLRPHLRDGRPRRSRPAHPRPGLVPPAARLRAPGGVPVLRDPPRQHRLRQARRRPTPRSRRRRAPSAPTSSSPSCPTATAPWSASGAGACPPVSAS